MSFVLDRRPWTVPAKGISGVRVPLRFFFSFCLSKNNPHDFLTDQ